MGRSNAGSLSGAPTSASRTKKLRSYEDLSARGRLSRLRRLAAAALERYGLGETELTFLQGGKQAVYRVRAPRGSAGERAGTHGWLLRVHTSPDQPPEMVHSEMQWLRAIQRDLPGVAPAPLTNLAGEDLTFIPIEGVPADFFCSMTRWVEGRCYLRRYGPGAEALYKVGHLMARLHQHGRQFVPPPWFRCRLWNSEALFGRNSGYFPRSGATMLNSAERKLFDLAIERFREAEACLGTGQEVFGLIHGDLIQTNYVFHEGEARAIDFADFGRGHFLYDIGVTLFGLWGRDRRGEQRAAFIRGYQELLPLSQEHVNWIDTFACGRAVALGHWLMGMAELGNRGCQREAPSYMANVLTGLEERLGR